MPKEDFNAEDDAEGAEMFATAALNEFERLKARLKKEAEEERAKEAADGSNQPK